MFPTEEEMDWLIMTEARNTITYFLELWNSSALVYCEGIFKPMPATTAALSHTVTMRSMKIV